MIELRHLSKTYSSSSQEVNALNDINLTINDGDVYGIIGMSGAGKSTLVRCINMLERPTSGQVLVDGKDRKRYGLFEPCRAQERKTLNHDDIPAVQSSDAEKLSEQCMFSDGACGNEEIRCKGPGHGAA